MKYVGLLRGVNVGGKTKVEMGKLKKVLEDSGLGEVKTLLNSGNVIFNSDIAEIEILSTKITQILKQAFGWEIGVILRSAEQIKRLVETDPFKGVKTNTETRLYVTFLSEREVASVINLSDSHGTTDLMKDLEKQYGQNITTRSWNTVQRIAKALLGS